MAINFPDSPSNGDTYTANGKTFVYNSTNTSWRPQTAAESGGTDVLADMAALIAKTGMSNGDQALVQSNNNLYMYSGSGWYKIATIQNDAPSAITGVDGSYALATDGTATTITAVSTDPEGFALTWSYTASGLGSIATVSQADNVFTVTPSTDAANDGSFTLTISATDGINGAVSTAPSFTLAFVVTNSRYTALSVKATNTGSNQTFDDASASNHTITASGSIVASTFSPHRHGGYSTYLGTQTSRYYSPSSSDFDIGGTGDWSYEAWVYADNQTFPSYPRAFGLGPYYNNTKSFGVLLKDADNSNNITVYWDDASGMGRKLISTTAFSQDVWHHILVCRSGNDIALYLDGTRIAHNNSYTSSIDSGDTYLYVGHTGHDSEGFAGYARDVRFINGSHPYDASGSSITVPTESLTAITNTKFLLGDLPYFKDQSTSNHAITFNGDVSSKPKSLFDNSPYSEASHGASVRFNGLTGDVIGLNGDAEFAFGTNDFTVEFWLYPVTRTATEAELVDFRGSSGNGTYTLLFLDNQYNTNNIIYYHQGGTRITSSPISDNAWSHVALTRSGNDVKLFVNGIQEGSTFTNSLSQLVGTNGPTFGAFHDGTFGLTGYMSDIRVLNGTAAYTSNFTPPAAPLTAITNTKFLLNPETSISDLSQKSHIACSGDAATSTTQVKFAGTKSIYLDGTGDYISIKPMLEFGQQDWTFETWVYVTGTGTYHLFSRGPANSTSVSALSINPNGQPSLQLWDGSTDRILSSGSTGDITINTWHHVVLTHTYTSASSSTYKIWVDGSEVTSITHTGGYHWSWSTLSGTNLLLGAYGYNNGQTGEMYLQDSRLTTELVRYTSTFTPPTSELEG